MKSIFPQPEPKFQNDGPEQSNGNLPVITKPPIDTRTEMEKFYDKAYEQGFKHCQQLFEKTAGVFPHAEISATLSKYIDEKFPNHMKQQTTQP